LVRVAQAERMFDECPSLSLGLTSPAKAQADTVLIAERRAPRARGTFVMGRALPARPEFASTIRGSLWRLSPGEPQR